MKALTILFFVLTSTQVLAESSARKLSSQQIFQAIKGAKSCGQLNIISRYLLESETKSSEEHISQARGKCQSIIMQKITATFGKDSSPETTRVLLAAFDQKLTTNSCLHLQNKAKSYEHCFLGKLTDFARDL